MMADIIFCHLVLRQKLRTTDLTFVERGGVSFLSSREDTLNSMMYVPSVVSRYGFNMLLAMGEKDS